MTKSYITNISNKILKKQELEATRKLTLINKIRKFNKEGYVIPKNTRFFSNKNDAQKVLNKLLKDTKYKNMKFSIKTLPSLNSNKNMYTIAKKRK